MIYRVPGSKDRGVGFFGRIMAAPNDRNQLSFYADAGLNFKGLVPGREADSFGIAFGTARVSSAARAADRDVAFYSGTYYPVRSSETVLEITYSAEITPGFTIQPDFQYIWHPGGGVLNPSDPLAISTIPNAAVFGVRTTLNY